MNRMALALGSFIVGACCMSIAFMLIHTSTRVLASQETPALVIGGAEPVVPPLSVHMEGIIISGPFQAIDGIDCDGCTITASRLTYAGGAFRLNDVRLPANVPIELKGAALNTLVLLRSVGALSSPSPAPQPNNNSKLKRAALELKMQNNLTLVSLEGVKR